MNESELCTAEKTRARERVIAAFQRESAAMLHELECAGLQISQLAALVSSSVDELVSIANASLAACNRKCYGDTIVALTLGVACRFKLAELLPKLDMCGRRHVALIHYAQLRHSLECEELCVPGTVVEFRRKS